MMFLYHFTVLLSLLAYCRGTRTNRVDARQGPGTYYAITGATGGVHPRLEIRQLEQTGVMWNLFLLALARFQAIDQNEMDSYYQIAGIHGMPWHDWDGVPFNTSNRRPPRIGYCPHHQLLFSTWHRPYLILFEQKLQSIATDIATGYGEPSYQDAARRLRLPYWDSAQAVPANEPVFPVALSTPKVLVTLPDGSSSEIDNPLYQYAFHPLDRSQINSTGCNFGANPAICNSVPKTVRRATNAARDTSDHDAVNAELRALLPSIRGDIYSALTQYHSFNDFSNDGSECNDAPVLSIESPHNRIHNLMDPGHMSPPPVSAFDPVFWLHHANVDRQIAIFQQLFPETYIEPCVAQDYTWTIPRGTLLDDQSPLTPFHKTTGGDWWTSANCRNLADLSYTYPELSDAPTNETLISRINTLYRDTSIATDIKVPNTTTTDIEYMVQIRMPASAQSSYNVVLFLGEMGDDPSKWISQDSFISKTSSLIAMDAQRSASTLGTVILTETVNREIATGGLQRAHIVEHVRANLRWRLELGGIEIPKSELPGITVTLISTEVERATSITELDQWVGGFQILGAIV